MQEFLGVIIFIADAGSVVSLACEEWKSVHFAF